MINRFLHLFRKPIKKGDYILVNTNDANPRVNSIVRVLEVLKNKYRHEFTVGHNCWSAGGPTMDSRPNWTTLCKDASQVIRRATHEEMEEFRSHQRLCVMSLKDLWQTKEWKKHNKQQNNGSNKI